MLMFKFQFTANVSNVYTASPFLLRGSTSTVSSFNTFTNGQTTLSTISEFGVYFDGSVVLCRWSLNRVVWDFERGGVVL